MSDRDRKHGYSAKADAANKYNNANRYGLTVAEYERMLERQGYRCKSCEDLMEVPCVDHDHDTGQIRDILCRNCNSALGMLKDNPIRVQLLFEYIARYKEV